MSSSRRALAPIALLAAGVSGCSIFSGYPSHTASYLHSFESGQFAEAGDAYLADASGGDELLYRFEAGLAYQSGGHFEKSKKAFETAETVIEGFDERPNISGRDVAEGLGAAFLNDKALPYDGANYERVLLNTFQALNYWMLGDVSGAMVEVRRSLIRKQDADKDPPAKGEPPENVFAQYLSATLRELTGDVDNAYIDYQQIHERAPAFELATRDLLRIAEATGRTRDIDRWRADLHGAPASVSIATDRESHDAELVVVALLGMAPFKDSTDLVLPTGHSLVRISIPKYVQRPDPALAVRIVVDGIERGRTELAENAEAVAMAQLTRKLPALVAKTLARATGRAVATEVVVHQLEQHSEGAAAATAFGAMIWALLVEQADLRSWLTLPRAFHVGRVVCEPGLREVRLELLSSGGTLLTSYSLGKLELLPRAAVPLYARSVGPMLHAYPGAIAIPSEAPPASAPTSIPRNRYRDRP